MIGTLGNIVFSCSGYYVKTFSELTKTSSIRSAQHDVIGGRPVVEFLGDDLSSLSFNMTFNEQFGTSPDDELDNLEYIKRNGIVCTLIIGERVYGEFLINNLSSKFDIFHRDGRLTKASVSIELMEYN